MQERDFYEIEVSPIHVHSGMKVLTLQRLAGGNFFPPFFCENLKISWGICKTREWEEKKKRKTTNKLQKHSQDGRSFLYIPYPCPGLSYTAADCHDTKGMGWMAPAGVGGQG